VRGALAATALLLALGPGVALAGSDPPAPKPMHQTPAKPLLMPRQPAPPKVATPEGFTPAPMPDADVEAPKGDTTQHTEADLKLHSAPRAGYHPGSGYLDGSAGRYDPERERGAWQASPGISLKVPLQ
jgi:hypothetical protein